MLKGKTILLGVTGGIAAYKIANLASALVKLHADVNVIMTQNATNFINPITFESLTGNKCIVDTFDRNFKFKVEHIALAELADVFMVAPASANVIGKIANGIADDMLTTTFMACKKKKILAPAMNTNMYENPIVQDNIKKLKAYGMEIIEPATGYLACGTTGSGKLPDEKILLEYILREVAYEKDLSGKTVLVTAGPTREAIDPVRFISNHSTGKMGYAIARCASLRGARVILVSGPVSIEPPLFAELVPVVSAEDMYNAVMKYKDEADIIIKSAAVADYTPVAVSSEKIKKQDGDMRIELRRTKDILKELGQSRRENQFICGFAMETENLIENAVRKLESKNVDMIVANSLKTEGAGFGTDTNVVTLITKDGKTELPLMSKDEVAMKILDAAVNR
ncbi:bifunctional phosphopantothenoylcysteine decarboxylase/phosphopantothenate--cysteine ligase CoaBC [Ruminococcus sp.]|uniref:bifunctional phosphopantothenoylcysteine decarboxylase/phosphopantothenate--cysteine ligase CoaBC n=1 Tax=Ruminococcus sp. TaxID=41978 RepID=UPI0025FC45B9|nr:bifunctional phosphopantothenoylcysteine decarboxylase/phosphopantothenate--cysteine ligase CoaBC [Ruminococcus sp.]MCI6615504.1 bifunctional phosphopantothenoylcysteine decarboxylase/phosphopantothenate--cysteine ligase CoaBC [Ruminococcus sp.]